jgi:hypothetical protein
LKTRPPNLRRSDGELVEVDRGAGGGDEVAVAVKQAGGRQLVDGAADRVALSEVLGVLG